MDFADTTAEWMTALERALSGQGVGTPEKRLAVARANSWDTRLDELDRVFRELVLIPREGTRQARAAAASLSSTNS